MTQPDENGQAKQLAAQQALVRLLNSPPENIVAMLDRLEIPWERKKLTKEGERYLIIKWDDLVEGEKRNQAAGPFIKTLVEEMQKNHNMKGVI